MKIMELIVSRSPAVSPLDVETMASFIAGLQKGSGEIAWSAGGKTDPWDHIESAMGLSVAGYLMEAERAYEWLARIQLEDGSWWAAYRDGAPEDQTKDANLSSYVAVGVFHHYLVTGDMAFLRSMWPTVRAGIEYAVDLQAPTGEIYWARNREGVVDPMALLTGSSSIYMSIKCALAIAARLGRNRPDWELAFAKLGQAIRHRPDLFNMIKSRYSMDWYYPVLCGAVTGLEARKRIDRYWDKYVVPGWGVRCVSDRPWVTMAETSELVLTLEAIGDYEQAEQIFHCLRDKKYDDGSYWMGVTFPDSVVWPEEKTSWTAAAVLLAFDTLNDLTPASCLFRHSFWDALEPQILVHTMERYQTHQVTKSWKRPPSRSLSVLEEQG
jgi:hypothetical protein